MECGNENIYGGGILYQLKIKLEGLPKTTNSRSRSHWRVLHTEAKRWQRATILAIGHNRPERALNKAKLVLTRHSSREPDYDGLVSTFKNCVDALKIAGVISDDKVSVIGQPEYHWAHAEMKHGFVTIEVYEVGEQVMDDVVAQGGAL